MPLPRLYLETMQGTHWCAENGHHGSSGETFHSVSSTKEARQSRRAWDIMMSAGSFILLLKRLLVQWPQRGVLSSNPCFYSNSICDIGNVTSPLTFPLTQHRSDAPTAMVPSSSGILGPAKPPMNKSQTLARPSTVNEEIKQHIN